MRLPDRFRTTSFRLSVGYALSFGISAFVIMAVTYVAASAQMQGIVRASIAEDMALFTHAFEEGGAAGLAEEVRERTGSAAADRFFLALGPDGAAVAGNLPPQAWRPGHSVAALPAPPAGAAPEPETGDRLYAEGRTLGTLRVMAARRSDILAEIDDILLSALLSGGVVTALLALVGGTLVGLGPTRRVDAIAATTRAIVDGRLDLRLPVSGRGDELDRLAADINVMLARIETLVASLQQVSADIAHDLRTPLSHLRQRLEGLPRAQGRAALERAAEEAVAGTDAIIQTFDALLRIAQIDAGARRSRFARLDLSALAERVADAYGEVARDAGHRFEASIEPGLAVFGDRDLLTQALANLVENAINHVPPPGRIALVLRGETGAARLEVRDDGPGIPEAERDRVFRRLYRLDRSRGTPGHGLGLALVASIAELHGARVTAADAGPGLVMTLDLPVLAADSPVAAPGGPARAGAGRGDYRSV
ncbi:HAMP domain-containing sensor histidine kinase [Aurantimonas sp. Leaf443]|uniref:sensor histidine kinase n=1 Tax=Aurantimonas sp. Leaf443 TaxID=1736378 RepID=UPI0009E6FCB0|nr:HAMP domain-containing sensor histidine kinase [Aurantimonas sp. Leaf443]